MIESPRSTELIQDMVQLALNSNINQAEDDDHFLESYYDAEPPNEDTKEKKTRQQSSSPLPPPPSSSSQARNPQQHNPSDTLPTSSTPPPVPDRKPTIASSASQELLGCGNPQEMPESVVPRDVWADQEGHFPLLLESISQYSIPVRGGTHLLFSGNNFRDGVQVVFECPQLGDAVEAKVITPFVLQSSELELLSPCLMDWWALWTRTRPTLPSRSLDLTVRLICPGASLPSDLETPCGMVSSEDSEIDLLQGIVSLHRQLIFANMNSQLDAEEERNTRQRTLALLELDQPSSVTRSEHLALGVIYMLCDGQDRISTKGMELILTKLPNGGHDMLHLSVILGLTTLVREIARHLLNRYQSMFKDQHDHQPIELEVLSVDTNGLTALDFAVELGYYEIEQVLIATMEAANEHKDEYLSQLAAHPLPKPPRNVLINRPLPPTPTGSPFVSTPEGSTEAGSSVSYFPLSAGGDGVTIVSTPAPAQRIQTAQAIIGSIDDQHSQSTVVENASAYAHSNQSTIIGSPSSTGSEGFDLPYQQSQQPYYPQQQHLHQHYPQSMAHPQQQQQQQQYTGPYRANTEPLPPRQLPILSLLNQNHHSDDPRFHQQQQLQNPQVEQSPQQIYKSSVAPFRPLPATPLSQTAPLPPPKHIVKQVRRPKQFTVPVPPSTATGAEPIRSSSNGSSTGSNSSGGGGAGHPSPQQPLYPNTYRPQQIPPVPPFTPMLQSTSLPYPQPQHYHQQPSPLHHHHQHPQAQPHHSPPLYPPQQHQFPPQPTPQSYPQQPMPQLPMPQQHHSYPYPQHVHTMPPH